MKKLTLGIIASKLVKFTNAEGVEQMYYRLQLSNGMSVKSQEPAGSYSGAIVEVHPKGSQPSWATEPLERDSVILKGLTTTAQLTAAKNFQEAASEFNALVAEEQPVGRPRAAAVA